MPVNQSQEPIKYFSTRDHADRLSFEEVSRSCWNQHGGEEREPRERAR